MGLSLCRRISKKNDSVVTQRIFRRHFNIHWNASVPSRNTVLLWVRNFKETASAAKRKRPGREPSLRTPENIERLRRAFVRSPRRSASRNAIALRMSDRTASRIFNEDLNFHPYKMVMVQAVNTARTAMRVLNEMFSARMISRRGNTEWSARSPDLNACDFFLWGYLKSKV